MGDMVARRCQMGTNACRSFSRSVFDTVLTGNGDNAGLTLPPSAKRNGQESLNEANLRNEVFPFVLDLPPLSWSSSAHMEFFVLPQRGPQQQQLAVNWERVRLDTRHFDCFPSSRAHRHRPCGGNQLAPEPSSPSLWRSSVGGESLNKLCFSCFAIANKSPTRV